MAGGGRGITEEGQKRRGEGRRRAGTTQQKLEIAPARGSSCAHDISTPQTKKRTGGQQMSIVGVHFSEAVLSRTGQMKGIGCPQEGGRWRLLKSFFQAHHGG